jgi:hypothetical protein
VYVLIDIINSKQMIFTLRASAAATMPSQDRAYTLKNSKTSFKDVDDLRFSARKLQQNSQYE